MDGFWATHHPGTPVQARRQEDGVRTGGARQHVFDEAAQLRTTHAACGVEGIPQQAFLGQPSNRTKKWPKWPSSFSHARVTSSDASSLDVADELQAEERVDDVV